MVKIGSSLQNAKVVPLDKMFFLVKPLGKNHVDGYGHYSLRNEKNRRVAEGNEKNKNK